MPFNIHSIIDTMTIGCPSLLVQFVFFIQSDVVMNIIDVAAAVSISVWLSTIRFSLWTFSLLTYAISTHSTLSMLRCCWSMQPPQLVLLLLLVMLSIIIVIIITWLTVHWFMASTATCRSAVQSGTGNSAWQKTLVDSSRLWPVPVNQQHTV